MKKITLFVATVLALSSCLKDKTEDIGPIVEPPMYLTYKTDSLITGEFRGLKIGSRAEDLYSQIQDTVKSSFHIAGNFVNDFSNLKQRLPLYEYIVFDEIRGTENGVQITFEGDKVNAIYLNNGNKLNQWPHKGSKTVVKMGMTINEAADALISLQKSQSGIFERTLLLTKNVKKNYDTEMAKSTLWYFAYEPEKNHLNGVSLHLKDGYLSAIVVRYMKL